MVPRKCTDLCTDPQGSAQRWVGLWKACSYLTSLLPFWVWIGKSWASGGHSVWFVCGGPVYACYLRLFSDRALILSKWRIVAGESSVPCSEYHVQLAYFPSSLSLSSLYCSCVQSPLASVGPLNFLTSLSSIVTCARRKPGLACVGKTSLEFSLLGLVSGLVVCSFFKIYVDNCNHLSGLYDSEFSSSRGIGCMCLWEKLDEKEFFVFSCPEDIFWPLSEFCRQGLLVTPCLNRELRQASEEKNK